MGQRGKSGDPAGGFVALGVLYPSVMLEGGVIGLGLLGGMEKTHLPHAKVGGAGTGIRGPLR
jgi:hypothetical protein